MRIDNRRDRVGRIVEAIDELETECDQQRANQHEVRAYRSRPLDRKVGNQMLCDVEQTGRANQAKDDSGAWPGLSREFFVNRKFCWMYTFDGRCHRGLPSASRSGYAKGIHTWSGLLTR